MTFCIAPPEILLIPPVLSGVYEVDEGAGRAGLTCLVDNQFSHPDVIRIDTGMLSQLMQFCSGQTTPKVFVFTCSPSSTLHTFVVSSIILWCFICSLDYHAL